MHGAGLRRNIRKITYRRWYQAPFLADPRETVLQLYAKVKSHSLATVTLLGKATCTTNIFKVARPYPACLGLGFARTSGTVPIRLPKCLSEPQTLASSTMSAK